MNRIIAPSRKLWTPPHRQGGYVVVDAYRFGGGSGLPTWNPEDKSSEITLAFADRQASKSAGGDGWASVRAVDALPAGKWYFEISTYTNAGYTDAMYGIAKASLALSGASGFAGGGAAGESYSIYQRDGKKWSAEVGASFGSGWPSTAMVLGFAGDFTNPSDGKLWIAQNNVYQGGGDPAAGTSPAFTGIVGTFFPMTSHYNGGTNYYGILPATSGDLVYAAPSGFPLYGT